MKKVRHERAEITSAEIKKNNKRILWTIICQQIGHTGRNVLVSRNMQPTKTESRWNR